MGEDELQQFKVQCAKYVDGVLEQIAALGDDVYLLDDDHLAALNVRKAEPLDIDEESVDYGPQFFSPRFTLQEAREKTAAFLAHHNENPNWAKRCRRRSFIGVLDNRKKTQDPSERHPLCTPEQCASFRLAWCLTTMGTYCNWSRDSSSNRGISHNSDWYCVGNVGLKSDYQLNLPAHDSYGTYVMTPPRPYTFWASKALLLKDPAAKKPHRGALVLDSTEPGEGEVLRSEVAVAAGLLKYQLRRGDFLEHYTSKLPSIVISFHHDRAGRINQFHFDGQSLVMRQSRLLDFCSDKPTVDAYQMMRWIEVRPLGHSFNPCSAQF